MRKHVTIVGLGYVGLPVACLCAEKGHHVNGLDTEKEKVDLINQSSSDNFFVKYNKDQIQLFSTGLNLNQVLEKINARLNGQCLYLNKENYCTNEKNKLVILANGNETYASGEFLPLEGDKIRIVYS